MEITFAKNYTLNDGSGKGRQELSNVGTLDGYYITNGKAIPVTWEKNSELDITRYYDKDGNQITLNTGKTYIAFVPYDNWRELVIK